MFIITNFGTSLFVSTIPYVFIHDLGANERTLSICFAILGAGALLGSFVSVKLMTRFRYGTIIIGASCFVGFCYFISACFNNYYMIAGLMCLAYGANSSVVVSFFTLRQKIVPATLLGRVTATTRMLVYAVIPFAAITSGYFLSNGGYYKHLLLISGTLILIGVLYRRKTPLFGAGDNIK